MLYVVQTALELGFMYALVAMALFLSYRILDIADMTTDSGFVLGAAVSVTCAAAGHPVLAVFAAMAAAACAGYVTAFLQTRMGVPSILAGIITNTGLYTVNLMVMGWSSNVSLLKQDTMFTLFRDLGIGGGFYKMILAGGITMFAGAALVWFLGTRLGLSIRATGDNEEMVRSSSINADLTRTAGVMLANALVALSGALLCQQQRYADLNCGSSMLVMGLASVIIGRALFGNRGIVGGLLSAVGGSLLYRVIIQAAYKIDMPSYGVKLLSTIIVVCALALPLLKRRAGQKGGAV